MRITVKRSGKRRKIRVVVPCPHRNETGAGVPGRGFRGADIIGESLIGVEFERHHLKLCNVGNILGPLHLQVRQARHDPISCACP